MQLSRFTNIIQRAFLFFGTLLTLSCCATDKVADTNEFVTIETQNTSAATKTEFGELRLSTKLGALTEHVRFGFASANLTPISKLALDEIADEIKTAANTFSKVRIVGVTDPTGHSDRNRRLSQARANTVREYLISRGVPAEKIDAIGNGPKGSMIKRSAVQLARARRVDFEILD